MRKRDRFKNLYFNEITYDVSKLSFDEDGSVIYEGKVLISSEQRRNSSITIKLCLKELFNTGRIICKTCGCEATFLRKIKCLNNKEKYGWGFFGIKKTKQGNKKIVLFSKDHIVPKSLDRFIHDNNKTMYNILCTHCNEEKGNHYNSLNFNERMKLADCIKKERWIKSYVGKYLNQFYNKHKENENLKSIITNYLNIHLESYVNLINLKNTNLKNLNYPIEFKTELEKDLCESLNNVITSIHENKNSKLVNTIKQFKILFINDILKNNILIL